jgi:hypothetical protein
MFIIYAPVIMPMCFKVTQMDNTDLWHNRYAHLSFKGLNTLVKKDMVQGLPKLQEKEEKCSDCMKGKQHREAIPREAQWRATKPLELVHSDICGPITPQSNGGCNNGIKRQLTTAYTPQQNGVSERKNRTLLNMVRSMLSGRNVPKSFWPEALKWATYVLNRSPTLSVKDMTPEEAWTGRKPTVHHFRVFGCLAYVHIHDAHRKKLDDKSIPCFLLALVKNQRGTSSMIHQIRKSLSLKILFLKNLKADSGKMTSQRNKQIQILQVALVNKMLT